MEKTELVNFDSVGNPLSREDGSGGLWSATFDKVGRQRTGRTRTAHGDDGLQRGGQRDDDDRCPREADQLWL